MMFMKKEKVNKFRINLGAIGREERENIFIDVEYNYIKDNKVKVSYSIGIYGCGMISYVVGYEIDVNLDEDIEEVLFDEAKRLHENGYFYSALELFYEELDYLETM
ncbi:hypothetical protein [Clostridium beijerinckii]|uniref:Uncharacterized protein n=1 Tax=Clostridium beijerinckii TaxID=1520 RepID=A0AAW3W6T1_CLOBE|nr:hypothetical protein [Clostridium beijerinckii]MBC2457536.1 hypothetical protein [Clostridium beijerinckii]MBC2474639.1 hypothetical protein [Clostridium beijerinckii]NOV62404.1 hypothetical protein [Clostridium beijerinckii]NOV68099.1 hypothetical protein [Clostridium beijerinckii]NOW30456.1 hypothetical protein [Clostridium beijerinckii]